MGRSSDAKARAFLHAAACLAAAWSVLAIAVHLGPFEGRHTLEMLAPVNLGIILWVLFAGTAALFSTRMRRLIADNLPDVSIWCLLAIAAASVAVSPHVRQSASSLAKLALMYIGAMTLFSVACGRDGWADRLCIAALAAACIAMIASAASRLSGDAGWGFFDNPYKYGTATTILFVLGIVYLASRQSLWAWLAAPATALAAITTVTLGGLCGIAAGLLAGVLVLWHRPARLRLATGLLTLAAVLVILWQTPVLSHLRDDARTGDSNGHDLRQRYIEWQAQLNLLEQRPVAGTGLGCVNEYRSMFYGRLPKLNTLQPFDRNGWLLIAAETGIFGLVAFVWVIVGAGRKAWQAARAPSSQTKVAATAFAALVAACVAGTFSSVNYNGVINSFVLVLALAHHVGRAEPRAPDTEAVAALRTASPGESQGCDEW
jgi:O-antigen ligase